MALETGSSAVDVFATEYIIRQMIPRLEANLMFAEMAETATIPRGEGKVAQWLRPVVEDLPTTYTLSEAGTTLSEVEITEFTIDAVTASITEYGNYTKMSTLAKMTAVSTTMSQYAEIMAELARRVIDTLIQAQAVTTTNFIHAGDKASGGATLATTDFVTAQDFAAIAGFFHGTNAQGWEKYNGDYGLIIHPDAEVDLVTHVDTTALSWSVVKEHTAGADAFSNLVSSNQKFVGRLGGVSAFRSTQIDTVTEDQVAHRNVAIARYGLGWAGISGKSTRPEAIIKSPGPQDTSNPLNLYSTLAYKITAAAKMLDANRVVVLYSYVGA